MFAEVIKVDAKGRITIPAYVRILLDVNEGSKVLMSVDEEKGTIILRAFSEKWIRCTGTMSKDELIDIIGKSKIVNIKCISDTTNIDVYRCDIIVESRGDIGKAFKGLQCFNE